MPSGGYRYRLNGEIAPVEERWTVTGSADGVQHVESCRTAGDINLAVTAELVSGRVQSCEVIWQSEVVPLVEARYEQTVTGTLWRRTVGGSTSEELINQALEGEVILYPLMRIFTGSVIAAIASSGGRSEVLVPDISSADEAQLLLPDISSREVVCEGRDSLDDHPGIDCQRWRFTGGQYDASAGFWLDQQSRLLRYQWRQSASQYWEVDLIA